MIHRVLPVLVAELNDFLRHTVSDTEDRVLLSALVDQSGALAFTGENRIICLLTGIEQERTNLNQVRASAVLKNPPIRLNLNLLFCAYFPANYEEGLKFISLILYFFQRKRVFTTQNTPHLPEKVDKISAEIINLDQAAQHQLWRTIGARMMPAVAIKLQTITIDHDQGMVDIPEITGVNTTL